MKRWYPFFLLFILVLAACSPAADTTPEDEAEPTSAPATSTSPSATATTASEPEEEVEPETEEVAETSDRCLPEGVAFNVRFWDQTNFCEHSIDFGEILSGGPPPDGIPAIDTPVFIPVSEADEWMEDREPVISLTVDGVTRAYPLQILMWHEIVNDTIAGQPVAVTFCPLCNATIVFNRVVDGQELTFGTSGNLRFSDLVMYDRQTQSWWQQFTGEAIVGDFTGTQLEFLPASIVAWADFQAEFADSEVLSRQTGFSRSYGLNPYTGYDDIDSNPFLFRGPTDGRLPAMARVASIELGEDFVAYPFSILEEVIVVNDSFGDLDLAVFWKPGTASALAESDISSARDVGATAIFNRTLDGQTLTFSPTSEEGIYTDAETGSQWNIFGEAVDGSLAGSQLEKLVSHEYFWFAWAAFRPDTIIYTG